MHNKTQQLIAQSDEGFAKLWPLTDKVVLTLDKHKKLAQLLKEAQDLLNYGLDSAAKQLPQSGAER